MKVIDVQKMSSAVLQQESCNEFKMAYFRLSKFIDFDTFFKWKNHCTSTCIGIPVSYRLIHHNGTDLNQNLSHSSFPVLYIYIYIYIWPFSSSIAYCSLVMDLHPSMCVLLLVSVITLMTALSK